MGPFAVSFLSFQKVFLFSVALFLVSLTARADRLSPYAVFNRCFNHLTGRVLPETDPRAVAMSSALATHEDAVVACMSLLENATLTPQGVLPDINSVEQKATLRVFFDTFRTWFTNDSFALALPNTPVNDNVYDRHPGPKYLLWSLFRKRPYKEVFTLNHTLETKRHLGHPYAWAPYRCDLDVIDGPRGVDPCNLQAQTVGVVNFRHLPVSNGVYTSMLAASAMNGPTPITVNPDLNTNPNSLFPQIGDMIGLLPVDGAEAETLYRYNMLVNAPRTPFTQQPLIPAPGGGQMAHNSPFDSIYFNRSFGGGVLGDPAYLLLNLGRGEYEVMDGGAKLPRRLMKNFFSDFMCRDLPVLRLSDVIEYTYPNSTLTFRSGLTCAQCHATIDTAASSARNFVLRNSHGFPNFEDVNHIFRSTPNLPDDGLAWSIQGDPNFGRRPPRGLLRYRSYDGQLNEIPVMGHQDFAARVAELRDPYVCAASRMFTFFTGIKVTLEDSGVLPADGLDETAKRYRDAVISWGEAFYQDRNNGAAFQELIRDIFSSDIYQSESMR